MTNIDTKIETAAKKNETAAKEVIEILKELPDERKAYLSGYAAGMNAERRLSAGTRSA